MRREQNRLQLAIVAAVLIGLATALAVVLVSGAPR